MDRASMVAIFAVMSVARNRDWQDAEHIWASTPNLYPEVGTLQNQHV